MREKLARAVLRDLRQQGHEHVELRRDGVTAVFYCSLCGTRCYNDSALGDHLNGKGHARKSVRDSNGEWQKQTKRAFNDDRESQNLASTTTTTTTVTTAAGRDEWDAGKNESPSSSSGECYVKVEPSSSERYSETIFAGESTMSSTTSLKWIGSGELFLRTKPTGMPFVEASWFSWQGMYKSADMSWSGNGNAARMEYAVVVFPYSDGIGRGGDWPSLNRSQTKATLAAVNKSMLNGRKHRVLKVPRMDGLRRQVSREIVVSSETSPCTPRHKAPLLPLTLTIRTKPTELASGEVLEIDGEPAEKGFEKDGPVTTFRKIWKQKQARNLDRICFICHQKLLASQDVAALVNVKTGQMICGSRNRRGVFHVFHSACLIEWIAFCEAKTWNASCTMSRKLKRRKTVHPNVQAAGATGRHDWFGTETEFTSETGIFCPECQGTGVKLEGPQLERPRFRLNQVYEWVMELIESRKAYMDEHGNPLGLLFVKPEKPKSQGVVQSQGFIHCYSAGGSRDLAPSSKMRGAELCK
ncbi:hypothetical protein M758_3G039800 [Ceratodon purpureus]|nr:hypothetical protein M758_3G039800 [Ceratodon purpureus]